MTQGENKAELFNCCFERLGVRVLPESCENFPDFELGGKLDFSSDCCKGKGWQILSWLLWIGRGEIPTWLLWGEGEVPTWLLWVGRGFWPDCWDRGVAEKCWLMETTLWMESMFTMAALSSSSSSSRITVLCEASTSSTSKIQTAMK